MASFANSPAVQAHIAALKPTKDDDPAIVAGIIDAVVAEIEENWRSAECVGEERDVFYAELHNPETNARELLGDQCEESPELTDEQWREVLDRLRVLFPNEEEWSEQCHACDTLLGGKVFHSEKEFDEHPDRDAGYNADGIWYCAEHREEAQKETFPRSIPFEDEHYKWDYDDKGVLCRFSKEKESWEVMEPSCVKCGHRDDECECEECPECGEMEDSVYDYPEGRMCCDCRHGFKDRECEECGVTFNPKDDDTYKVCADCWDKKDEGESEEESEDEEEEEAQKGDGRCVYCKAESAYECDRCKESDEGDGGAMCLACSKEHGHEVGGVFLCGGCFEQHGGEEEESEEEDE